MINKKREKLMKTEIWVSFNYRGYSLVYSKTILLPFAPFFGLSIITNDEMEYEIRLINDNYCRTTISYNLQKQQFEVNVRNIWKQPVTRETVDGVIEEFSDWERKDITNINDLIELMKAVWLGGKK